MKKLTLLGVLVVSIVALSACVGSSAPEGSMQEDSPAVEQESMMENTSEAQTEFEIDMSNFKFSQTEMTVPAGKEISVKLTNSEGFHDFVVDELDVASKQIQAGDETMVTFTASADNVGKNYEYYCSVGEHRQMGMVGKITIVE